MTLRVIAVSLLVGALALASCQRADSSAKKGAAAAVSTDDAKWRAGLDEWKKQRLVSIGGEDGWVTLVGRIWLSAGANHLGSDPKSELALPADRAPAHAGTIFLEGDKLRIEVSDGVDLTSDGKPVKSMSFADDRDQKPTMFALGSLRFHVIKRQDRWALRVKDRESPARKTFAGLTYYPVDPSLRVLARLVAAPAGKTAPIVNVLGQTEQMPTPGTLHFAIAGAEYTLDAVREPGEDELFILFRDQTAGQGTYPSGRFLYTPLPAADGTVELDFNRAFTPPCGFTNYATCPLPPKQNLLSVKIEAGEKSAAHHREKSAAHDE